MAARGWRQGDVMSTGTRRVLGNGREAVAAGATGDRLTTGLSPRGVPLHWRWLIPVVVIAAAAAWVVGVRAGLETGGLQRTLIIMGAGFTAVAVGLPLWEDARTAWTRADAVASAEAARASMRIAMEDALDPYVALLLQMAAAHGAERNRLRGEAVQLALTTLCQESVLVGPEEAERLRIRACLFRLDPGPPRQLVPQSYAGRSGAPTTSFDDTTRAGQVLLRNVDGGWVIVDSTEEQRFTPWWDEERGYRTYVAGPVPGPDGRPVALLTLDALEPGDLADVDLPLVRLVAHLLSLAYQI